MVSALKFHLTCLFGFVGSSCPVTTVNEVATPLCVTGSPADVGTPIAEVTPGINSTCILF